MNTNSWSCFCLQSPVWPGDCVWVSLHRSRESRRERAGVSEGPRRSPPAHSPSVGPALRVLDPAEGAGTGRGQQALGLAPQGAPCQPGTRRPPLVPRRTLGPADEGPGSGGRLLPQRRLVPELSWQLFTSRTQTGCWWRHGPPSGSHSPPGPREPQAPPVLSDGPHALASRRLRGVPGSPGRLGTDR